MATLQLIPKKQISQKAIPAQIQKIIKKIFSNSPKDLWLVGGTALAGYFAEHRRSDDIDLFTKDKTTYESSYRTIQALKNKGVQFFNESRTPYYFHADVDYENHQFTIDLVLDSHLFHVGSGIQTEDGVWIADIETIFKMKLACLVSRCSEKDLFDLVWFYEKKGDIDISEIINKGSQIDSGLNIETLLISLQGSTLREQACHFLLLDSPLKVKDVFKMIQNFKKKLIEALLLFEKNMSLSPDVKALKQSVKDQK